MTRSLLSKTMLLLAVLIASDVGAAEYKGICEASAGVFIDSTHFAVASDETNKLQIYERGKPEPIGNGSTWRLLRPSTNPISKQPR